MEYEQVTGFGWSGDELEQLPGGVGADDEQSVVGVDQADGIGDGVADRLVTDAVAPSSLRDPHVQFCTTLPRDPTRKWIPD